MSKRRKLEVADTTQNSNVVLRGTTVRCLPDSPKPYSPKLGFRVSVSANRVSANRDWTHGTYRGATAVPFFYGTSTVGITVLFSTAIPQLPRFFGTVLSNVDTQ